MLQSQTNNNSSVILQNFQLLKVKWGINFLFGDTVYDPKCVRSGLLKGSQWDVFCHRP